MPWNPPGALRAVFFSFAFAALLLAAPAHAQPTPDPDTPGEDPAEAAGRVQGLTPPDGAPPAHPTPHLPDDPNRPPDDPAADPARTAAPEADPRTSAPPGATGPALPPLTGAVLTTEPSRLLLADLQQDLHLCDLATGRCRSQGSAADAGLPACATHLRNGWSWAMTPEGRGTSLCADACGPDFRPGAPPPLPPNALSLLPEGATEACGNAPAGASFWVGRHTLQRWGDRPDAEVVPLPGATGAPLQAALSTAGRLWLVRDGHLWARPWDPRDGLAFTAFADTTPESTAWPPACAPATRRVDQLLYAAPLPRGARAGLRAGIWSVGPCGLVPLHLFDLPEGRSEALLWPEDVYRRPAWPPPQRLTAALHPLHTLWIVAPDAAGAARQLWGASPGDLTLRLLPQPPLRDLTAVVQLDATPYALGDGALELPSLRRVGLQQEDGQPFGAERLRARMAEARGDAFAVLTQRPAALWLWRPGHRWPLHVPIARDLDPSTLQAIAFTQTHTGDPALAYQLPDGAWWEQPLDLAVPPRRRDAPPVPPPPPPARANAARPARGAAPENDHLAVNGTALGIGALLALLVLGGVIWWKRRGP